MEYFLVYLVTMLDGVRLVLSLVFGIVILVYLISFIADNPNEHIGARKVLLAVICVLGSVLFLAPNTKQATAIIIGGKLLKTVNSDLAERSVQAIEKIITHQAPEVQ